MKRYLSLLLLSFVLFSQTVQAQAAKCPDIAPLPFNIEELDLSATIPLRTELNNSLTEPTQKLWLDMIRSARSTIDIGQFYLDDKQGKALEPIMQELANAAGRGVKIRILIDKKFYKKSLPTVERIKDLPGIEIQWFNWGQLTGGIIHAKYFIVDMEETFVGSHNFAWRALIYNHETGLRIKSKAFAAALGYIFELDWLFTKGSTGVYECAKANSPFRFSDQLYMVASPPPLLPQGIGDSLTELIRLIDSAREKIDIQLYHYSLKGYSGEEFYTIDQALKRASKRGIKVRIVLDISAKRVPDTEAIKSLDSFPNIEVRFAKFPKDQAGDTSYARLIHSKYMRVDDDISWIGTSNWGYDYFLKSRNIELVVKIEAVSRTLDALFEDLWESRYAIGVNQTKDVASAELN